jgi:hypothetical protein
VGKIVQPLQSVNCHDSRAHSHEQHGPFTRLVGILVGMVWVGSSRSGLWYAAGVKHVYMLWLQVGCLLALVFCGYRCDSCELEALDYRG